MTINNVWYNKQNIKIKLCYSINSHIEWLQGCDLGRTGRLHHGWWVAAELRMQHVPKYTRERIGLIDLPFILAIMLSARTGDVLYSGYLFYKTENSLKCCISFQGHTLCFSGHT